MPSLRERREDIPLLAAHFLDKYARAFQRTLAGLTPDALRALTGYGWPGNVRELEHAVERAVVVATGTEIDACDLPEDLRENRGENLPIETLVKLPYREALDTAKNRFTRDYLAALMREFEGNVTRAAERAAIERESLHRLLRRHGVRSDDFKSELD
jgi:DNA-binding NtrC family response regulator